MTAKYRVVDVQSFTLSLVLLLLSACSVYAFDAPHNESNGIGCDSCHDITSSQPKRMPAWTAHPPVDIDDTQFNTLCWSCHNEVIAPYMKTHSSLQANDDYGNWSVECWVCHNQHAQDQFRAYGAASYLYSGTSATVAASTLSVPGNPWTVDQYAGYILIPNTASPYYNYTITGNTTNTLTVLGPIDLSEVTDGDSFAIVYGKLIRSRLVLDDIIDQSLPAPYVRSGDKTVRFLQAAGPGFVDKVNPVPQGICQVCHTQTTYWLADGTQQTHFENRECLDCHKHSDGFIHGGGGTDCGTCHGHEDGYNGSVQGTYKGSTQSHSTHTESDDDFVGPRPVLACADCHNTAKFPKFRSKADPNAELTLTQTDICNDCHSEGGPYDGLNDAVIGAKNNWRNGIYTTNAASLKTGKERWCVTCHDSGTSNINGRQAPDVAGNNSTYGYYQSGHGAFFTKCGECHGVNMDHNFDGQKTYVASSPQNYKEGYRLADVDGGDPLAIPASEDDCNYTSSKYRLCFSCHSEQNLLQDTRSQSGSNCTTNPFKNAASITTGFSNLNPAGGTSPVNLHWEHIIDYNMAVGSHLWDSDGSGPWDSEAGCMTCHNPHGPSLADNNTPTVRMTTRELGISTGTDGTGDFGLGPDPNHQCAICHTSASKYYRPTPPPSNPTVPDTPVNATPVDGATDLLQPPTITASVFSDVDVNDTHQNSQWLISSASGGDFAANQLYNSGAVAGTNSHTAAISWISGATYYWKVRYQDNHGIWSEYSTDTGFTLLTNSMPAQPIHVAPAPGAMNVDRQPMLVASDFSDTDTGDIHLASVWQISTAEGTEFSTGLVYTSGHIAPTTSHAAPVQLDANRRYYWRTRYQDSKGQWSEISTITSFTTTSLISMFHFDEGSGAIAYDAVEDNDGEIRNGATWTTGFLGQGLVFDGVDDDVLWSYADGVPTDTFTIEAMVKATTTHQIDAEAYSGTSGTSGQKYLFGANIIGGTQAGAGVSLGTNGISVYEHSGGYMPPLAVYNPAAKSPVQPQLGTDWNHVVVSYTETQPRIYLNGHLVHTGLMSTMYDVFAPTQLARGSYGAFAGTIDEVAIYGKALTKTEILQRCLELGQCVSGDTDGDGITDSLDNCPHEYNTDQADLNNNDIGNVCDYLGYWKLDEGSGYITVDESGRNHVRIATFDQWTTGVAGGSAFAGNGYNNVEIENMLDNHNGDFSLSIWLKFPTGTTNPMWSLGKGDAYNNIGFGIAHWVETDTPIPPGLFLNDGTPEALHRVSLYASSIPRDTWGHFVWTIDRANNIMKVYKNGQYENQLDISILGTNPVTESGVLDFATPTHIFTGALDNVAVYDFVLEPGDIQARCKADAGVGNCP